MRGCDIKVLYPHSACSRQVSREREFMDGNKLEIREKLLWEDLMRFLLSSMFYRSPFENLQRNAPRCSEGLQSVT